MKEAIKCKIQERIAIMLEKGWVFKPYSAQQLLDLMTALLPQV
jgi:hypothetical protein